MLVHKPLWDVTVRHLSKTFYDQQNAVSVCVGQVVWGH